MVVLCHFHHPALCDGSIAFAFAEEELKGLMEEIMSEDLNRWNKADKNKDSKLSRDEFLSFQHPEHNEQSIEAMAEDLMGQMDDDRDLVRKTVNTVNA
jgi:hypothetical protein